MVAETVEHALTLDARRMLALYVALVHKTNKGAAAIPPRRRTRQLVWYGG